MPAGVASQPRTELVTSGELEKASVTGHELELADRTLKYRATTAEMPMMTEEGELKASIFFVAYDRS